MDQEMGKVELVSDLDEVGSNAGARIPGVGTTGVEGAAQQITLIKNEKPLISDQKTDPDFVIERAEENIKNLIIFRR